MRFVGPALVIVGAAVAVAGFALISPPVAMIVGGSMAMFLGRGVIEEAESKAGER